MQLCKGPTSKKEETSQIGLSNIGTFYLFLSLSIDLIPSSSSVAKLPWKN